MEAAVLLSVLGAGYLLNKPSNDNDNNDNIDLPAETDAYDTNYFQQSDEEYKKAIFDNYEKSRVPGANIVNYQNIENHNEAIKWYRISAEQGHAFAQNSLAQMYLEGKGTEINYKKALDIYR